LVIFLLHFIEGTTIANKTPSTSKDTLILKLALLFVMEGYIWTAKTVQISKMFCIQVTYPLL